ncbi:MAG: hyaluronate lyase, partial [Pedobacter sp.]|nr:hyaluronate lyase [Chitinophagaceae bacterium]
MNKTNISFSILLFFCINATGQVPSALDAYDSLRIKWKNILTGANTSYSEKYVDAKVAYITKDAQANWDKLEKHTDRAFLWQDLASTTISAEITYAYRRIYTMALAYNLPSSYLKGDKILRDDIVNALIWMDKNRYVK